MSHAERIENEIDFLMWVDLNLLPEEQYIRSEITERVQHLEKELCELTGADYDED